MINLLSGSFTHSIARSDTVGVHEAVSKYNKFNIATKAPKLQNSQNAEYQRIYFGENFVFLCFTGIDCILRQPHCLFFCIFASEFSQ